MIAAKMQDAIDQVLEVLQPYLPLISCHMVDFLSHDLWNTLIPQDIRTEISQLGADEAFNSMMLSNFDEGHVCSPLKIFLERNKNVSSFSTSSSEDLWDCLQNLGATVITPPPQLTMFMSPKKAHEVQALSRVIAALVQVNDVGCVIDLGGGKGYLGSTLAYHYGLHVLSIDCATVNTHGAFKLANNLKKWWDTMHQTSSHIETKEVQNLYKQDTSFVRHDTNLKEFVLKNFQSEADHTKNIQRLCLVGLHACGDLTPSCIKLFCNNPDIRSLCIVGCCYNLITENIEENSSQNSEETGFPMSNYLKNKGFVLGRNARMLAAQSIERITENCKPPPVNLWYRALLQMLLIERVVNTDLQVGRLKSSIKDFPEYVSKALAKLNLSPASSEEVKGVLQKYQRWEKLHNVFFMMRVSLAPVIETLILLDRLLYLKEEGIEHTYLVQLFDSVISPRCCGIIAFKK